MANPVTFCFKRFPLLSRLTLWCLLPLFIALMVVRSELRESIPLYEGEMALPGLSSAVTVSFDDRGMAKVSAQNDRDAYFAQGYLHASERMWQMVVQRRLLYGRLSEVFGRTTVASDRWMRTLGLKQAAQNAWQNTPEAPRAALQAYSDGVNAWIAQAQPLPPEFLFFDLQPELWQPMDSLAWQKAFALDLGQNFRMEILRLNALKLMNLEQLSTFFPYDDCSPQAGNCAALSGVNIAWSQDDATKDFEKYASWQALNKEMVEKFGLGERFAGSNGWVISGDRSKSGSPILANDPHLSIQMPSLWYAMSIRGDKLNVEGMSLVGMPGIMLGRNDNISWGATALTGDNQDLFILDVPLKNNAVYRLDGADVAIESHQEQIEIRADSPTVLNKEIEPLTVTVRNTRLGPIVTDVIATDSRTMALRWTALEENDQSFEAFYQLQYAKNWTEFRGALRKLGAPGLHFIYADKNGNIGSQVAGKLPKRATGDGAWPQFASSTQDDWQGYIDFDRLPRSFNPESGMIVSANNRIQSEPDVIISHEWAPDTRARRIVELLAKDNKLTIEHMVQMQKDEIDIDALALVSWMKQAGVFDALKNQAPEKHHDAIVAASDILANWDGNYGVNSVGATLYHYWLSQLKSDLFNQALSNTSNGHSTYANKGIMDSLLALVQQKQMLKILSEDNSSWCDAIQPKTCRSLLQGSFYHTIDELVKHFEGDDVADWQWGEVHFVEFVHRPFGQIRLLEKWFSTELPSGGSVDTLNVGSGRKDDSGNYVQDFGSVFRQVFDMADEASYMSWGAGQSGHFLSRFYDDAPEQFYDAGAAIDLTDKAVVSTLRLLPQTEAQQ